MAATAKNWSSIDRGKRIIQKLEEEKRTRQGELRARAQKKERPAGTSPHTRVLICVLMCVAVAALSST